MLGSNQSYVPDSILSLGSAGRGNAGRSSAARPAIFSSSGLNGMLDAMAADKASADRKKKTHAACDGEDGRTALAPAVILLGIALGFPLAIVAFLLGAGVVAILTMFYMPAVLVIAALVLRAAICPRS